MLSLVNWWLLFKSRRFNLRPEVFVNCDGKLTMCRHKDSNLLEIHFLYSHNRHPECGAHTLTYCPQCSLRAGQWTLSGSSQAQKCKMFISSKPCLFEFFFPITKLWIIKTSHLGIFSKKSHLGILHKCKIQTQWSILRENRPDWFQDVIFFFLWFAVWLWKKKALIWTDMVWGR